MFLVLHTVRLAIQIHRPRTIAVLSFHFLFAGILAPVAGQINEPITSSEFSVPIELFARFPKTDSRPVARLNVLREEPGGTDRLFVNDLNGYLYSLDKTTREASTYLDIADEFPYLKTSPGLASGFISFAFHPNFAANGKFYTIHAEDLNEDHQTSTVEPPQGSFAQTSVLTEWISNTPSANAFNGSRRELLRLGTPGSFHPMGDVLFNPTAMKSDPDYGLLYISIGDGQSFAVNQPENLQRLDSILGSVLRIDPNIDGQPLLGESGEYSIPGSNPWASDDDASTFAELFANGFRNPHRLAFDAETGILLTTDIGERHVEEINVVHAGGNYGWPLREGSFALAGGALPENDSEFGFSYPVAQYDHDEGYAISNGVVYRGSLLSELDGKFIFGDIVNGRVFFADLDELLASDDGVPETTAEIKELQLLYDNSEADFLDVVSASAGRELGRTDLRLGLGTAGELYLMSKQTGEIYVASTLANSILDCNLDGVIDRNDLACSCSLGESERSLLFTELGVFRSDLDGDGAVAFSDFLILSKNFAMADASHLDGDIDCSGRVDFSDFLILSSEFGKPSRDLGMVPESVTGSWFILTVLVSVCKRHEKAAKELVGHR